MSTTIENFRKRTGLTQQAVADMLHTDKTNISHIEHARRPVTAAMYEAGFNNIPDAQALNDLAYEVTKGHTTPTASDRVYDGHRMSYAYRIQKEIDEFVHVLHRNRLDKHPEFITPEEREGLQTVISELQDVLFEGTGFVNRLMQDYDLIPQKVNKTRDARLKMERRI